MGAGQAAEDGITALGLDYRLLTAFTSFVAIDSQVVNPGGQGHDVRQPLPMPEGVSNLAVGEQAASVGGPMKSMGALGGAGYGHGGGGLRARAPMPAAAGPPPPAEPSGRAAADEASRPAVATRGRDKSDGDAKAGKKEEEREGESQT